MRVGEIAAALADGDVTVLAWLDGRVYVVRHIYGTELDLFYDEDRNDLAGNDMWAIPVSCLDAIEVES